MENIKLAFETIVVGLLAIPWILIFLHVGLYLASGTRLFSKLRVAVRESEVSLAVAGTFILGIAYCLGTIIFPIADDVFNDNHEVLGVRIKKDGYIRTEVLAEAYFKDKYYQPDDKHFPTSLGKTVQSVEEKRRDALTLLALHDKEEESRKLLPRLKVLYRTYYLGREQKEPFTGADKKSIKDKHDDLDDRFHAIYNYQKFYVYNTARGYDILQPLHSRIVVLRGAVLDGIMLLFALVTLTLVVLGEMLVKLLKAAIKALRRRRRLRKFASALFSILILHKLLKSRQREQG